jgi:glycosyltransferase involved in cell wall biosynthesis
MGWGSGAYVIHKELESYIPNYRVKAYNPYWTMFPFALQKVAPIKGADLIHTTSDYGIFFHVGNIPLVLTIHGYTLDPWIRSYSTWAQKIHCATDLRLFTMMSLKKAAVVTAVSHYIARLAQEDLRMVLPIKVIYNGVDTKMFSPARYSMTHQNEVKVFFSGNLKVRKGSHWLPGIANKLNKNIRIFYTQGLRAQNILPLSPNIESIGSVSFEQMPDRYRQMDILLMPTVREGFGLSVAEAMACGLPVVVSDCSSLPELIDHGKGGYLCPVGNVDMFAEKINFLAENPDLRKQMGEYNRAKVEMMFSLDQMIENYKKLFEETLDTWKK